MNKQDLVAVVAQSSGLSKAETSRAIDATFDAITTALKTGKSVRLMGFGLFRVAERAAGEGRNPRTGDRIMVRATRKAKFSPGQVLKGILNG